jgi:hypothetical protein
VIGQSNALCGWCAAHTAAPRCGEIFPKIPAFFPGPRWRDLTILANKPLEIKRQKDLPHSQTVHNQRIIFLKKEWHNTCQHGLMRHSFVVVPAACPCS